MSTTKLDIESLTTIAGVLEASISSVEHEHQLQIGPDREHPAIVLVISQLVSGETHLSAQTTYGYFELHNVTGYVEVEPDEVIFVSRGTDSVSGMVVGCQGNCSLYAGVSPETITSDFTQLDPALLLAAMQLGLADSVLS